MFPALSTTLYLILVSLSTVYVIVPVFPFVVNSLVVHAPFSYHWNSFIPDSLSVPFNVIFTSSFVQFPLLGFVILSIVGFVLSIFFISNEAVTLFPSISVASAYTVPFFSTVTLVAFAVFASPYPAFLFCVRFAPYSTVTFTFPFVHSVMSGVSFILFASNVLSPTVNTFDTFISSALFPALSFTFVHK